MRKFALILAILTLSTALRAQQEINNDTIVKMVKAGLSEEVVLSTVNSQPGRYDVSADGLIALKKAGVGDKVISAIVARGSGAPAGAASSSSGFAAPASSGFGAPATSAVPPQVDSVGVYYKDKDGGWSEVVTEVVNFKTGGALKHLGTVGIIKEDLNGHLGGFKSHLDLKAPADFIFYVPEGRSPGEYQLLRLRINKEGREFRSITGGAVHESGGAIRDTVDFTPKKIAPRVYAITLGPDIGKGEYGFLPPLDSVSGKSIASSGKMYTFTLGN